MQKIIKNVTETTNLIAYVDRIYADDQIIFLVADIPISEPCREERYPMSKIRELCEIHMRRIITKPELEESKIPQYVEHMATDIRNFTNTHQFLYFVAYWNWRMMCKRTMHNTVCHQSSYVSWIGDTGFSLHIFSYKSQTTKKMETIMSYELAAKMSGPLLGDALTGVLWEDLAKAGMESLGDKLCTNPSYAKGQLDLYARLFRCIPMSDLFLIVNDVNHASLDDEYEPYVLLNNYHTSPTIPNSTGVYTDTNEPFDIDLLLNDIAMVQRRPDNEVFVSLNEGVDRKDPRLWAYLHACFQSGIDVKIYDHSYAPYIAIMQ